MPEHAMILIVLFSHPRRVTLNASYIPRGLWSLYRTQSMKRSMMRAVSINERVSSLQFLSLVSYSSSVLFAEDM